MLLNTFVWVPLGH